MAKKTSTLTYVNSATLAALCGVTRAAITNWRARGGDVHLKPDAFLTNGDPLWLQANAEKIAEAHRETIISTLRKTEDRLSRATDILTKSRPHTPRKREVTVS